MKSYLEIRTGRAHGRKAWHWRIQVHTLDASDSLDGRRPERKLSPSGTCTQGFPDSYLRRSLSGHFCFGETSAVISLLSCPTSTLSRVEGKEREYMHPHIDRFSDRTSGAPLPRKTSEGPGSALFLIPPVAFPGTLRPKYSENKRGRRNGIKYLSQFREASSLREL